MLKQLSDIPGFEPHQITALNGVDRKKVVALWQSMLGGFRAQNGGALLQSISGTGLELRANPNSPEPDYLYTLRVQTGDTLVDISVRISAMDMLDIGLILSTALPPLSLLSEINLISVPEKHND